MSATKRVAVAVVVFFVLAPTTYWVLGRVLAPAPTPPPRVECLGTTTGFSCKAEMSAPGKVCWTLHTKCEPANREHIAQTCSPALESAGYASVNVTFAEFSPPITTSCSSVWIDGVR